MPESDDNLISHDVHQSIMDATGIDLQFGHDFKRFKALCAPLAKRGPLNPVFDPDHIEGGDVQGIWAAGYDQAGELVHTQAMRLVDLTETNLADHLTASGHRYRVAGFEADPHRTRVELSPDASRAAGTALYHGELWSAKGANGLIRDAKVPIISRALFGYTLGRYEPDFYFGIIEGRNVCRGLGACIGYVRTEPRAITLQIVNGMPDLSGWLVWMTREEAQFTARLEPEYFQNLLAPRTSINQAA